MTTVDARVSEVGGGFAFEVENGLGGPATGLMFAMMNAVRTGELVGRYDEASAEAVCPGYRLIALVNEMTASRGYWKAGGRIVTVDQVLAALKPGASYNVSAAEF